MTAWHALVTAGRVQPGETVLVNAAGSGVSTAIVQFAVAAGATVIGTAGGAEKVAKASISDVRMRSTTTGDAGSGRGRPRHHRWSRRRPRRRPRRARHCSTHRSVRCRSTAGWCSVARPPARRSRSICPSLYHWGRTLIGAGGYRPAEFVEMLATDADRRAFVRSSTRSGRSSSSPKHSSAWPRVHSSASSSSRSTTFDPTPSANSAER